MGQVSSKGFLSGQPFPADFYDYKLKKAVSLGTFLVNNKDLGDVKYVMVAYNNLRSASRKYNEAQDDLRPEFDELDCKIAKAESGDKEVDKYKEYGNDKGNVKLFETFDGRPMDEIETPDDIRNIKNDDKNEIDVICEPCTKAMKNMRMYHVVIIIQDTNLVFWSIEKNDVSIIVQKSGICKKILKNLMGTCRAEELKYDVEIERLFKEEDKRYDDMMMPPIYEVLNFVTSIETQLGYHSLSHLFNCQGFMKRIVVYIYERDVRRNCDLLNDLHWKISMQPFLELLMKFYPLIFTKPKLTYTELKKKSDALKECFESI